MSDPISDSLNRDYPEVREALALIQIETQLELLGAEVCWYEEDGLEGLALSEKDIPEIYDLADWVDREWKSGKKVLIRCQAGLNRSGLIMALVLIKEGHDPKDAIGLIRARRSPNALCNADFVRYLEGLTSGNLRTLETRSL